MRDKKRIPKILRELERIWEANPDYRLGQLIMVATKPKTPCPSIFYIEDDKLLKGLLAFEERIIETSNKVPNWKKYPDISRIKMEELTLELIEKMINTIKIYQKNIVITPINLMRLNGAPVSDNNWLLSQKQRRKKIKNLLRQLQEKGILEERQVKQGTQIAEIGYNVIDK